MLVPDSTPSRVSSGRWGLSRIHFNDLRQSPGLMASIRMPSSGERRMARTQRHSFAIVLGDMSPDSARAFTRASTYAPKLSALGMMAPSSTLYASSAFVAMEWVPSKHLVLRPSSSVSTHRRHLRHLPLDLSLSRFQMPADLICMLYCTRLSVQVGHPGPRDRRQTDAGSQFF